MIISVQKLAGDKIKYNRLPKNTKTQQEIIKGILKRQVKYTGIYQKRFPD